METIKFQRERIQGLAALSADDGQSAKDIPQPGKKKLSDRIRALRKQVKKLEADKEKLLIRLVDYYQTLPAAWHRRSRNWKQRIRISAVSSGGCIWKTII